MGKVMGLLDTVKELAGKIFTNGIKVEPEIARKRLRICKSCKFLLRTGNCKKCLCFVDEKTKYKDQRCPVGKW